jgi:hypothetical protein
VIAAPPDALADSRSLASFALAFCLRLRALLVGFDFRLRRLLGSGVIEITSVCRRGSASSRSLAEQVSQVEALTAARRADSSPTVCSPPLLLPPLPGEAVGDGRPGLTFLPAPAGKLQHTHPALSALEVGPSSEPM